MKKRYWLRGLLMGILIGILFPAINLLGGLGCMGFYNGVDTSTISNFLCPLLIYIANKVGSPVLFPFWLVTGTFLGWVYGQIKNKAVIS